MPRSFLAVLLRIVLITIGVAVASSPSSTTTSGRCRALTPEGRALMAFRGTMEEPDARIQRSWRESDETACGGWFGIECETGRVVAMNLTGVFLHGELVKELAELSELRILLLSGTNTSGRIPPELFAAMPKLEVLDLSENGLEGEIPMVAIAGNGFFGSGQLEELYLYSNNLGGGVGALMQPPIASKLRVLWIHDNNFTGKLPEWGSGSGSGSGSESGSGSGSCELESLRLGGNPGLSGSIPGSLVGSCRKLAFVGAAATGLSGTLPPALGSLPNLTALSIYSTSISGSIPAELANCSTLTSLFLHLNRLSGPIPSALGNLSSSLTHLLLWGNDLDGTIPAELSRCSSLQTLDLSSNRLSGRIPPELGSLPNLQHLLLSLNSLSGSIPAELRNCASLVDLQLDNNRLEGIIPAALGSLRRLQTLFLWRNSLSGSIPAEIANCSSLQALDLSYNLLSGPIPAPLFALRNLTKLILISNRLSGPLPITAKLMSNFSDPDSDPDPDPDSDPDSSALSRLRLSSNNLSGPLPPQLGLLRSLVFLDLYNNRFHGPIPAEMANLSSMQGLDLHSNLLSGAIPGELFAGSLAGLLQLDLRSNLLSGSIPPEIGRLRELTKLDLSANLLSGSIPGNHLRGLAKLTLLDLSSNKLSGSIPSELGNLTGLDIGLNLSWNELSGELPPQLAGLAQLQSLDLAHNRLSGSLRILASMESLTSLDVSFNLFDGAIPSTPFFRSLPPSSVVGNPGLCILQDSSSDSPPSSSIVASASTLPSCAELLLHSRSSAMAKQKTVSLIVCLLVAICAFALLVIGAVLIAKKKMFKDQELHLQEVESPWPWSVTYFCKLNLSIDDVLDGLVERNVVGKGCSGRVYRVEVPGGQFIAVKKLWRSKHEEDDEEGGYDKDDDEEEEEEDEVEAPAAIAEHRNHQNHQIPHHHQLQHHQIQDQHHQIPQHQQIPDQHHQIPDQHHQQHQQIPDQHHQLPHHQLQLQQIQDQHHQQHQQIPDHHRQIPHHQLYHHQQIQDHRRRHRPQDRRDVRRQPQHRQQHRHHHHYYYHHHHHHQRQGHHDQQHQHRRDGRDRRRHRRDHHDAFSCEIETLGRIRHRNIVRLLGYCSNRAERLLLYDYMPNGSLADVLFDQRKPPMIDLDWDTRYEIVLGAAHGLAYLHHDCSPPILHRDVKCNNILLGPRFQPFLADFGLARLVHSAAHNHNHDLDNMSKVAGSYGYIAPEYGYTLHITEKSDVYSFGVVLLEVITGRRAIEPSTSDGLHIVEWVKSMKRSCNPSAEMLDPRLRGLPDPFIQEMDQAMGIALLCVNRIPSDRPTMKDVVALLLEIKHPLLEDQFGCSFNDPNAPNLPSTPTKTSTVHALLPLHDPHIVPDQLQLHLLDAHHIESLHTDDDRSASFLL